MTAQLHFKDIVLLSPHVSFLIKDLLRWIAGKSGDWQMTVLSLIRRWSIIEVLTLIFSAVNPRQTACVDFIFLWQRVWFCARGQVRTSYQGPAKHPLTAQLITLSLWACWFGVPSPLVWTDHPQWACRWVRLISGACTYTKIILLTGNIYIYITYKQTEVDPKIYNYGFSVELVERLKASTGAQFFLFFLQQ